MRHAHARRRTDATTQVNDVLPCASSLFIRQMDSFFFFAKKANRLRHAVDIDSDRGSFLVSER
jgi:hypothetical protein